MLDATPSITARSVAVLRALHQEADQPVVFADGLALKILGADGAALVRAEMARRFERAQLRASVAARSRIAEDVLADAASQGVRQYVLLGAGLDSFGCRDALADVAVFEVDHPATQGWKRALLAEARLAVPPRLRFVPMDFERQDLHEVLAGAGFRLDRPAVFAMLGVTIYVDKAALLRTWATVAAMPPGTARLVFDYAEDHADAPEAVRAAREALARRVALAGEPWRTCFRPAELRALLLELGFRDVVDEDAGAMAARLFAGRADGLRPGTLSHVVVTRN